MTKRAHLWRWLRVCLLTFFAAFVAAVVFLYLKFAPTADDRLLAAARKGDIAAARSALRKGANVNVTETWGWYREPGQTPLTITALRGDLPFVKVLLDAGADPTARDGHDRAPLMAAAAGNHVNVIRELLRRGAQNQPPSNKSWQAHNSAVHEAAMFRRAEALQVLLEAGLSPNEANLHAKTPLHYAAEVGDVGIAQQLLQAKADPNRRDNGGHSPLMEAIRCGHLPIIRLLLDHQSLNEPPPLRPSSSNQFESALHVAVRHRQREALRILLESNVDPDAANSQGPNPLYLACMMADVESVKLLLEHEADPDGGSRPPQWTPLDQVQHKIGDWLKTLDRDRLTKDANEILQTLEPLLECRTLLIQYGGTESSKAPAIVQ